MEGNIPWVGCIYQDHGIHDMLNTLDSHHLPTTANCCQLPPTTACSATFPSAPAPTSMTRHPRCQWEGKVCGKGKCVRRSSCPCVVWDAANISPARIADETTGEETGLPHPGTRAPDGEPDGPVQRASGGPLPRPPLRERPSGHVSLLGAQGQCRPLYNSSHISRKYCGVERFHLSACPTVPALLSLPWTPFRSVVVPSWSRTRWCRSTEPRSRTHSRNRSRCP